MSGGGQRYGINTELFSRQASATKGEDATKIGIGAGAGAAIGAIRGKKGAAEGAAVGGGAGTGVVLATKGDEVRSSRRRRHDTVDGAAGGARPSDQLTSSSGAKV